jgi:hypothetical protein
MADPISIASAVLGIIGSIVAVGGAAFNLANSNSDAVERLHAFERELEEFIELWEQIERSVDLQSDDIGEGVRRAFCGFVERTNQDLRNALTEFNRFYHDEREYNGSDWRWCMPLTLFFGSSPRRRRVKRLRRFVRRDIVQIHQMRLASITSGIAPWLYVVTYVIVHRAMEHIANVSRVSRMPRRGHPSRRARQTFEQQQERHERKQKEQRDKEHKAGVDHVDLSLLNATIEVSVRTGSPIEETLHTLNVQASRSTIRRTPPKRRKRRNPAVPLSAQSTSADQHDVADRRLNDMAEQQRRATQDAQYWRIQHQNCRDHLRLAEQDIGRLRERLHQERELRKRAESDYHDLAEELATYRASETLAGGLQSDVTLSSEAMSIDPIWQDPHTESTHIQQSRRFDAQPDYETEVASNGYASQLAPDHVTGGQRQQRGARGMPPVSMKNVHDPDSAYGSGTSNPGSRSSSMRRH